MGGGHLSHKKMEYNYSKKMFTGRVKPIRIIGDSNNQRPDRWSSTVLSIAVCILNGQSPCCYSQCKHIGCAMGLET